MKFKSGQRRKTVDYEKDLVRYWKSNQIFEKSVEKRPETNSFVFYDGPPFITGVPHHGTLLSSVVKDAVPRYWTMKGKRVERVWGWDCHGLPAEVFTEKKLGIQDKRDIGTKISLEEYIVTCRDNMVATGNLWEDTIDRIGRWVDFKGAYKTMDKEYMESVWWAFKTLYEKGKIYEGEKVLMYCTRDATPLSKAEIAMDNSYQEDTDPSVYVKFKLEDGRFLVAWTTTPWTLPSNSAIAVNKTIKYAEIEYNNEHLIIAESLVQRVMTDEKHQPLEYKILDTFSGQKLVGMSYVPLFKDSGLEDNERAFRVWHADFVHDEEGSGIAHESPAYGEEDYQLSKENDIPWILSTDENGFFTMGPWHGQNVWEVNKEIAKQLLRSGDVLKIEYIKHSYPHCYRCGTKLMYRAVPSWFLDIEGQRQQMLEENSEDITWFPEHIKHGRFEKTVQSAPDWNLSRDRFWATPIPVWKGVDKEGNEHIKVVGSYDELEELSGVRLDDYHRPWIDDVTFTINNVIYKRIDKVIDCWFESGSMPFAQFHYPFENVQKFENNFPGDFIAEYVGQVRAWFYYLHAVNVGLFGTSAFKNVIVTGSVMGSDGKKLSKSLGNYTDPNIVMDQYSADALRFTLLSSPVTAGEDMTLKDKDIADNARKLSMIWNMYDFFTLYAEVDGWQWNADANSQVQDSTNNLDRWIISRVHELIQEVEKHMERYDIQSALRPVVPFIEDASNWYVRRSRKRFWKSGDSEDKNMAYQTLHYVLVQLAYVLAPFTPFLAEELYRNLTGGLSVHLQDWPKAGHINQLLIDEMKIVREVINEGLSQRALAGIKVRQPLQSISVTEDMFGVCSHYEDIVLEELNVKELVSDKEIRLNTQITKELMQEGLSREVIRHVQTARKQAGLQVDDRIVLRMTSSDKEIKAVLELFKDIIRHEVLASKYITTGIVASEDAYTTEVRIGESKLTIELYKQG